jgi:membrane-associated protease RseP (regulator of RpoE activity)
MSFFIYDIAFLIVFGLFLVVFLYSRRKKLTREGPLYLYKTQVGIKIINYIGKKFEKPLKVASYLVIATGYALMIYMSYLLVKSVEIFLKPENVQAIKIPPLAPLIPYLPQLFQVTWLPPFYFTYWIIALAVVAVSHEFSHGIFARLYNIKIKSTGFGFLGPFLAAFVEPDEKKMTKLKKNQQITILSAGTFANCIMALLFIVLGFLFFKLAFIPSGVIFNTYSFDVVNVSQIDSMGKQVLIDFGGGLNLTEIHINNKTFFANTKDALNLTGKSFIYAFDNSPALNAGLKGVIVKLNGDQVKDNSNLRAQISAFSPGDQIILTTLYNNSQKDYTIILASNPLNKTKPYVGIAVLPQAQGMMSKVRAALTFFKDSNTYYQGRFGNDFALFIDNLLWWIVLINVSVALVNMLPLSIFDGGRVFYLTMLIFFKEKTAKRLFKAATYLIIGIFALLMVLWAMAYF